MSYSELRGKIRAKYGTQAAFAAAMGMDPSTLSFKLCGKSEWDRAEIELACSLLDIPLTEAHTYFFSADS